MDKKQEIVQEIIRIANQANSGSLTQKDFVQKSSIPLSTLRYHFGSFNKAVEAAGLDPNEPGIPITGYQKLTDDELFEEIGNLWKKCGKRPTLSFLNAEGKFSITPYKKRWGSFDKAVDEYLHLYGEPDVQKDVPENISKFVRAKQKPVVIPKTHKPKSEAAKQKRIIYGEPLEFRGLRYAPVNEQGVVYLFGMVSRELGFLIESVRTDFPDCEGKRCLNSEGTKWEHVKIEFELKSSNFLEHGHDPDNCDLIVCWSHDWEDSPIEVLELKTGIRRLTKE